MKKAAIALLLGSSIAFAGQKEKPKAQTAASGAQERRAASASGEDIQALRQDIARMKVLIQQMQSNLAFVDNTQSPLKHEFELDIQMWQTVIAQMERRLEQISREPANR